MFRFTLAAGALALSQLAFSQALPAFQWVKQVDASGPDSVAGLGVDRQGNSYIAGSTYAATFPVKSAVQSHLASAGLYRIDGPGSAYAALGITSASSIVVDPQSPSTLYATSSGSLFRSTDGGTTFSVLPLPSSTLFSVAINPANDKILYAGAFDQGLLKSTDAGATWTPSNGGLQPRNPGQYGFEGLWIDPLHPNVLFANVLSEFVRSADGGASWQVLSDAYILGVTFDTANPGVVYASTNLGAASKSTDDGQTFSSLTTPAPLGTILPDPQHSGRLIGLSESAIFESDDGGSTWSQKINLGIQVNDFDFVADWTNGFLYTGNQYVVRVTSDLQTVTAVGPASIGFIYGLAAANGHAYVAVSGTRDVYVTKLDPSGNIVYSTYFGGSADDVATAMAVDPSGNVYVTGTTTSLDFPVTKGAYATTGGSFLFKLNPDGSVGYSTYFAPGGTNPGFIAVDASGSAYIGGSSGANLPVTPGAYQTMCNCPSIPAFFMTIFQSSGFVTKFDLAGANLLYSTYVGGAVELFENIVTAFAVAPDGSAYLAGARGIFHLNAGGSSLLATLPLVINPQAMAVAPDGSVYIAGAPGSLTANPFQTTAGAFESTISGPQSLPGQGSAIPTAVGRWDSQLANLLDATYFGNSYKQILAMTLDSAGTLYLGGATAAQGLPTRTPLQEGFAPTTGFLSELSGDLSTLLFSSYLGDTQVFTVQGLGVRSDGTVVIGGSTGQVNNATAGPLNVWVNALTNAPPPALRIDSVVSAASLLDGPISAGETIVVQGAGFGTGAQLLIGGAAVTPVSVTSTAITAAVPQGIPQGAVLFQVQSGGAVSNSVLVPVTVTSPAIFSQDGSGFGPGYILNKDGTLNKPSNPAKPGDQITIFATGVGPVTFVQGYAVTQFPVVMLLDGFYCDGVAAVMGPVQGLPGSVYQITVTIPNPASFASANPNLENFVFPPLVGIIMQINGVSSQNGIAISISQ